MKDLGELEKRILRGSKDINEHLMLGDLYFKAGDYEKLIILYNQTIKLQLSKLDQARIYYEKGEALQLLNKPEDAIASFSEAIQTLQHEEDTWESLYIKGLSSYSLYLLCSDINEAKQHSKAAFNYLKVITDKYPDHDEIGYVYSPLADIYAKNGEYDSALHCYNMALSQKADDYSTVQYLCGIASVYGMKKQYSLAAQYFKDALKTANNTNTSKIFYDMGVMYFEANTLTDANQAFKNALEKMKNDPLLQDNKEYKVDVHWYLGTIAYELGSSRGDVVENFEKVLELIDKKHFYYTSTNLTLGHFYSMTKEFGKAREYYNNVLTAPLSNDEDIKMANECLTQLPFDA